MAATVKDPGCLTVNMEYTGCMTVNVEDAGFMTANLEDTGCLTVNVEDTGCLAANVKDAGFLTANAKDAGCLRVNVEDAGWMTANVEDAGCMTANVDGAGCMTVNVEDASCLTANVEDTGCLTANVEDAGFMTANLEDTGCLTVNVEETGFMAGNVDCRSSEIKIANILCTHCTGAICWKRLQSVLCDDKETLSKDVPLDNPKCGNKAVIYIRVLFWIFIVIFKLLLIMHNDVMVALYILLLSTNSRPDYHYIIGQMLYFILFPPFQFDVWWIAILLCKVRRLPLLTLQVSRYLL